MLFKDEVRAVGAELGCPSGWSGASPSPGPGLAIRIVGGEVTRERLDILRAADAILQEEIRAAELYRQLWQSFCVLPVVRSVGVQGDGRTYAYPIVIRAVTSDDAMTADWARLPYDLLERVSNRIINEIRDVNRVALDISSKPPPRSSGGVSPSFAVSIATLSLFQALLVALPRERPPFAWMPRSPWWALAPAASIVVVVFGIEVAPDSADLLTWLALLAVPPLAAAALGWLVHGARPWWAWLALPLFAVAWAGEGSLAGETAATLLSGLSCVAIGWLLVSVVPGRWLRWGIYAMAAIDAVLIGAELLQAPSAVLSAADPGGLPRLQVLEFGAARMGFGDAFLAATAGCLLAGDRVTQLRAAALVAVLGLCFDLLFFALDTLPATVPVAVALALVSRWGSVGVADEGHRINGDKAGDGQGDAPP